MRSIIARLQDAVGVEAIDVVELALQRITENVVSLRDPFEALFGMVIARIDIRMIPAGQFPKSALDIVHRGFSINLKNDIKIFSAGHSHFIDGCALSRLRSQPLTLLVFLLLVCVDVLGIDNVVRLSARPTR